MAVLVDCVPNTLGGTFRQFSTNIDRNLYHCAEQTDYMLRIQIGCKPNLMTDSCYNAQKIKSLTSIRFCICHFKSLQLPFLSRVASYSSKCANLYYFTAEYGLQAYVNQVFSALCIKHRACYL